MKQISTSLASKLKKDSVVERDYIIFSGETTKHYLWFKLYDDCYKDGNFIGTFILKRIEISYNDSDLEFKNKEFNAYKEYKLDNGTWESINYGTFVVTDVQESDTKEETTITAYDYGLKFSNTYKTDLDYASGTVTLFQVLQEVCQKVGVELENTSIDNGNFIVDSNQFTEASLYGNVITAIAQMSCNFAKITPDNKLKLMLENESNITIDVGDYEEFEDKRDTLPYTAVTLGMSNVEGENVSLIASGVDPDDAKYLVINDNPFAYTEEKRTQLIQAIFDKINGFGYSSFVLDNCLYPQLECGDLIQIRNKEGQLVDSIVLRPTFEEVVLNFEAPSTITSTVSYVQPESAIDVAKRTEIVVDKQNQTITAIVTNVDDNTEAINNIASEGESTTNPFVLENAAELNYIQVDIHGNSQQETTTGKNFLSKKLNEYSKKTDHITVDEASENLLKLSVTSNSTSYENVQLLSIPVESGKTYTLSAKIEGNTNSSIRVAKNNSGAGADHVGSAKNEQPLTFTCDGSYSHIGIFFYVSESVKPTSDLTATFSNVQLEEGDVATDYEEYTGGEPSPNPDYPQEITTIKDNVKLLQVGKNKLKIEDQVITSSGVTFTFKSGVCTLSGTASANEIYCLIENTNFTINAGTYTCNNGSGNPYPYVSLYYDNSYHRINVYDDNGIKKFDLDKDIVVTKIRFYFNKNWIDKTTAFSPQIEKGDVATDFDAYKEKEYVIDLQGNELSKLTDDIKDKLLIDSQGNVILEKNIRHLSLAIKDMNNSSNYPGWKNIEQLQKDYSNINGNLSAVASFKNNITSNIKAFGINTLQNGGLLFIVKSIINITQEEWIAQYPALVLDLYYSLKSTETISLSKIDDFVAFKGNSTLWVETNLEQSYQLCRYYKDSILTNYFPTKNEVETKFEITNGKIESSINEIKNLIKYVSNSGSLTIENASENNLSLLSIKGDISLLFGNDGQTYGSPPTQGVPYAQPLYPSPNLFSKNMNLIIEYTEDDKEVYNLPFKYLNYLSQEVADEFILEDGKAKIIRRVGINSSMQKYELPEEVIEELGELVINLKEGTNKLYMQCFDSAIYTAGYMEKNDYTDQFATKVELNSSISQLSNNITLEVDGKLDTFDEDINAKLELKVDTKNLVSEINASADVIRLDSNRFSMTSDYSSITEDGEATFKKADIGGFITNETSFSKDLNGIYDYSTFDIQILRYTLLDYLNLSKDTAMQEILDAYEDNVLNAADMQKIRQIILKQTENTKVAKGKISINSNNPKNCLVVTDDTNKTVVSIGVGGVNANQIVSQNIVCSDTTSNAIESGNYVTINGIDGNLRASGKVEATTITQTSIAEKKKNFELYQDALSEIAKIDIYKYNLIDEQDDDKKHIGFVIGNDFNYSKEITNKENDQVDLYSMISMCMQGLKQQQEIIKKLEKRIEVLENENIGKN